MKHDQLLGPVPDVTLLTSVPALPVCAARFLAREMLAAYYDDTAERVLAPARETLARAGIAAESVRCKGAPAARIAEHASSNADDVIVMGSQGHSALANLAFGSVVSGVLARCRTPLLLVR